MECPWLQAPGCLTILADIPSLCVSGVKFPICYPKFNKKSPYFLMIWWFSMKKNQPHPTHQKNFHLEMLKILPCFSPKGGHTGTRRDRPLIPNKLQEKRIWLFEDFFVSLYRDWSSDLPSGSSIYRLYIGTILWTAVMIIGLSELLSVHWHECLNMDMETTFRTVQPRDYIMRLFTEWCRYIPENRRTYHSKGSNEDTNVNL